MTSTPISWAKVAVTKPKPKPTPQKTSPPAQHFPALAKQSSAKAPPGFEAVKPSLPQSPAPVKKKPLTKTLSEETGKPKLSDILRRETVAPKKKPQQKLKRSIDSGLVALADAKQQKYQTISYIRSQYQGVKGTSQLKKLVEGLRLSKEKEIEKLRQLEHEIEAVEQKLKFDKDGSSSIPEFQMMSKEIRLRKRRIELVRNHIKAANERIEILLDDDNAGNDLIDNINNLIDEFNEEFIFDPSRMTPSADSLGSSAPSIESFSSSGRSDSLDSLGDSRPSTPASLNPSAEVFSPSKSRPSTPIMSTAQRYKKWVEEKMAPEFAAMNAEPPQQPAPAMPMIPNVPRYCALVTYMPGLWMMQSPVAVNCYKYIILPKSRNVPAVLHSTQPYCTTGQFSH